MQNKLDNLFALGKEFPELISMEEVGQLIQQPISSRTGWKWKYLWWSLSLVVLAFIGFFILMPEQNEHMEVKSLPNQTILEPMTMVQDTPEHPIPIQSSSAHPVQPLKTRPLFQSNITDDFIYSTPGQVLQITPRIDQPWELTADELKPFGIYLYGSKLEYTTICDTNFNDSIRRLCLSGDIGKEKNFFYFLLNTSATGGTRSESGAKSDTLLFRDSHLFYPAFVEVDMNASSDVGPQINLLDWNYISINSASAYTAEAKPYLIPIRIVLDTMIDGKLKENHIVFWFKPEPGVLALLPERVVKKYSANASSNLKRYYEVRRNYLGWQWTKKNELAFDSETVKYYRSLYRYPTRRQLRKIGFTIGPKFLLWKYNNRYLNNSGEVVELDLLLARNYRFNGSGFRPKAKLRKSDKAFYPVAYSKLDMNWFTYLFYDHDLISNLERADRNEAKFKVLLPELVPICIKADDEWVVFWFKGIK